MSDAAGASARPDGWVDVARGHRLTLVVAPPGWGKSSLLRALARDDRDITVTRPAAGWTPFTLARRLLEGLEAHAPGVPGDLLPVHVAPDSPDLPEQTAALAANVCAAAAAVTGDLLVLIDDADAAPQDPLAGFLESLVLHLPRQLHLVLACRQAPPLRLARLRAAGAVTRISAADLAVTADEVAGWNLDPAARTIVLDILGATGGWPLAVRLAVEALRRNGPLDRPTLVDHMLAPDAVLFDYLAEEVLGGAGPAERQLLGLAAALPYVSVGLLGALGHAELADVLAPLGDAGIFLEPAPHGPGTYQASLLGGEFLRRSQPAPPVDVRRRAVHVLVEQGDIEPALVLCTDLGDPALAVDVALAVRRPDRLSSPEVLAGALRLAEQAGPHPRVAELDGDLRYLRGEWDAALASYAGAVASGDAASVRLARKRAVILYLRGRLDEAEEVAEQARLDGREPAEEAQVLAWRAAMRWVRGDVAGCEQLVQRAATAAEASGEDVAMATVDTTRAMLAALHGDRRSNARWYQRALVHAQRAEDVVQTVRILTNRGSHHIEEGSYDEALVDLGRAIEMAELIGSETFSALAYSNRGDAFMHLGRLDDALRDLRRAQAVWERLGSEMVDYALGQLGRVQALRGQRSEALSLFRQAILLAERRGDVQALVPGLIGVAEVLRREDPEAALAAAERAIAIAQPMWRPGAVLAAGWIELDRGDRRAARRRADEAMRLAHTHNDRPAAAEALLLRAALTDPPSAAVAEEAGRLWHDLGDPIGEARSLVLVARSRPGPEGNEVLATAERMLADAGAWGHVAEARMSRVAASRTPVAFRTLGGFRAARDGRPVDAGEWGSRKARDLMKLLIARRGAPVVRDEAAAMLWPEESDRSARRLSVLLSTIRGVLDPERSFPPEHFVAADHGSVWLVREHVEVDVELFLREAAEGRRLLAAGEEDKAGAVLNEAAARYAGDFLADDPYADWAAGLRELGRHTFVDVAAELGRLADARGERGEAIRYRLRMLDVDPYDEAAHLDLIRALSRHRRHGEARRAYRTYCARLHDLDLDPAPFPE